MAYGAPSVPEVIDELLAKGVDALVTVPMFPQYASATVGSVLEAVYSIAGGKPNVPPLHVVPPFYDDATFLDAWAEIAGPQLDEFQPEHILLSYHGLPERQIHTCDTSGVHCLMRDDCCEHFREKQPDCYRAHCLATTRGIAERLGLSGSDYTLCFQSKLGRSAWLRPTLDRVIVEKGKQGVKRLAVISPAFVADCLETLEELGLRGKEDFLNSGGESFLLVSSLNDHPRWVESMAGLVEAVLPRGRISSVEPA